MALTQSTSHSSNIQIIAKSVWDQSVLEATSEQVDYPIENLQFEQISSKWRSADVADQQIVSDLVQLVPLSGFSLNGHNLSFGSTVQLSLYQSIARSLVVATHTDLGGDSHTFAFTTPHGLHNDGKPYAVYIAAHGTTTAFIIEATYVDGVTVSVTSPHFNAETANGAAAVSLGQVYDQTKDGVVPTLGWGLQAWGLDGWYGYATSQKAQTFVNFWFHNHEGDDRSDIDIIANFSRVIIKDSTNPAGFIEAGRMILGNAFQPKFNMLWGAGINYRSQTTTTRTRSGSIISDNRPSYRVADFTLSYLNELEAMELLDMMDNPSNKSDALISMYPDNFNQLGQVTTMLGRFMSHSSLTRSQYGYTMNVTFEEGL